MTYGAPVDGFALYYNRLSPRPTARQVVLLHSWPGDHTDYRHVVPLLIERHGLDALARGVWSEYLTDWYV